MYLSDDVINQLVGERVFGLPAGSSVPSYTADLEIALPIVDRLRAVFADLSGVGTPSVTILTKEQFVVETDAAGSAPRALCMAALRCLGVWDAA
jgi:hypothetical protein